MYVPSFHLDPKGLPRPRPVGCLTRFKVCASLLVIAIIRHLCSWRLAQWQGSDLRHYSLKYRDGIPSLETFEICGYIPIYDPNGERESLWLGKMI